jgi:hypothetical protein
MSCKVVDAPTDIDIEALKRKYEQERDKRLRPDAEDQYIEVTDEFARFCEVDPWSPPLVRDAISVDIDVAVLGGGFGGLMAGANLRNAGIDNFRIIDFAGDFGGTWFGTAIPSCSAISSRTAICRCSKRPTTCPKRNTPTGPKSMSIATASGGTTICMKKRYSGPGPRAALGRVAQALAHCD